MARSALARLAALALCCCLLVQQAVAYPDLWPGIANGCVDHPAKPYARHPAPVPDTTTAFALTAPGSSAPAASLCPGVEYRVAVDYGAAGPRRTLLTASAGTFGADTDDACPNRAVGGSSTDVYTNTLTLACTAKGPSVQLKVSSAAGSRDAFHAAAATLPLKPVAQCPASSCPGAGQAAAAAAVPKPAAAAAPAEPPAKAPAGPQDGAAAAAAPAPAAATVVREAEPPAAAVRAAGAPAGSGSGCEGSAFGYACAVPLGDGATLHYSSGGTAPPDNTCTAASSGPPTGATATDAPSEWLHLLLEAPVEGYTGLSFPATRGRMSPADAVIGYTQPDSGDPVVSAYHLTDYSPAPSPANFNARGWAASMGAARAGGRSLLCFSRLLDDPAADVVKALNPDSLVLNWAGASSRDLAAPHELTGDLTLNLRDGAASTATLSAGSLAAVLAHGALMLLAFMALMPAGSLLARHKWAFGNAAKGGIAPGWFHGHRALQGLALILGLAGFILGLVVFDVSWSLAAPKPHKLYDAHRILGIVVMGLVGLQAFGGIIRPAMTHARRRNWRHGHQKLGWFTTALGIAVSFLGIVLMHDLEAQPWVNWLLPACLILGLLVIGGALLEARKRKLQAAGIFQAASHRFEPAKASDGGSAGGSPLVGGKRGGGQNGAGQV